MSSCDGEASSHLSRSHRNHYSSYDSVGQNSIKIYIQWSPNASSHNLCSWLRSYLSFHWQFSFFIRTTTPKNIVMFIKWESVCAPLPYVNAIINVLNYIRAVKNYGCCIGNIRFLLLLHFAFRKWWRTSWNTIWCDSGK